MTTEKQTAANRENAKRSTGPRTAEGKARSSQNALKTGIDAQSEIIRGESREKLEAIIVQLDQEYSPATSAERFQVDVLARCTWLMIRYAKADAQIWEAGMKAAFQATEKDEVGRGFYQREATFTRLGRRVDATRRAFTDAEREFERLQANRFAAEVLEPQPEPAPQPPQPDETAAPTEELGSNAKTGPEPAPSQPQTPAPTPATPKFAPEPASDPRRTPEQAPPKSA